MKVILALGVVVFIMICFAAKKDAKLTKSIEESRKLGTKDEDIEKELES